MESGYEKNTFSYIAVDQDINIESHVESLW